MFAIDGPRGTFYVYRSESGGDLRVSLGNELHVKTNADGTKEEATRLNKGSGTSSAYAQYTQDTQLHPEMLRAVEERINANSDSGFEPVADNRAVRLLEGGALKAAQEDFKQRSRSTRLGGGKLFALLSAVRPGEFSAQQIERSLGDTQFGGERQWDRYIEAVNEQLVQDGVLPDFSDRMGVVASHSFNHPQFGQTEVEVFEKNGVEWHMARSTDNPRAVWIERIRSKDAKPTVYGTDDVVPYSGFLTSKPLEYTQSTSGIPPEDRRRVQGTDYEDITSLLGKLKPISDYAQSL